MNTNLEQKFEMDLTEEEKPKKKPSQNIVDGWYDGEITVFEPRTSKSTQKLYFYCVIKIIDGTFKDETVVMRLTTIKGKRWMLRQLVDSTLGDKGRDDKFHYVFSPRQMMGQKVALKVKLNYNEQYGAQADVVSIGKKGFRPQEQQSDGQDFKFTGEAQ